MDTIVAAEPVVGAAQAATEELPLPTIFIRAAAQNIDILVAAVAAFSLVFAVRAVGAPEHIVGVVGYGSFVLAFLLADALPNGQSVGKKLFHLSVREVRTGKPCSIVRSFARNIFVVLGLIDWLFMIGPSRRRLGDHAAGTRVIRVKTPA